MCLRLSEMDSLSNRLSSILVGIGQMNFSRVKSQLLDSEKIQQKMSRLYQAAKN